MSEVTWVLEPDIFDGNDQLIRAAIRDRGHRIVDWRDAWWYDGVPSHIPSNSVVFHGSLGNASRIASELSWKPGSFCPVSRFHCSFWYESARSWLVHTDWFFCTAETLVADASKIAKKLGSKDRLFVRPDSPLKPFSGRVVEVDTLTLAKLDHGFYYDDQSLPVVVAPVRIVGNEWRFVVVNGSVVSGSAYDPQSHTPVMTPLDSLAADFASKIAAELPAPDIVYVLDVCECEGQLRLLELNPFGGADLYACDALAIVDQVSAIAANE